MRALSIVASTTLLAFVGCTHGEPFAGTDSRENTPFESSQPARLTYAAGVNQRPAFSEDGRSITYSLQHPDATGSEPPDRCLGVLPATGGQRVATICAPRDSGPTSFLLSKRLGIEHGALSSSGLVAYELHVGARFGFTSDSGSLMVAPLDSLWAAREVLKLRRTPAGALGRWDYLLNPTWDGPGELVALAVRTELVPPFPFAQPDTIYIGLEIVRLDISGPETSWTRIAPAPGATVMAFDRVNRIAFYAAGDTVFSSTAGVVYEAGAAPGAVDARITGLAVVDDDLFIAERVVEVLPPANATVHVRIIRLRNGTSELIHGLSTNSGTSGTALGGIAVAPGGERLVFEEIGFGASALYLQELSQ